MVFSDILGQSTAVQTLRRALASGRLHHAYRFEGPDGIGKERCAFALAQALVILATAVAARLLPIRSPRLVPHNESAVSA